MVFRLTVVRHGPAALETTIGAAARWSRRGTSPLVASLLCDPRPPRMQPQHTPEAPCGQHVASALRLRKLTPESLCAAACGDLVSAAVVSGTIAYVRHGQLPTSVAPTASSSSVSGGVPRPVGICLGLSLRDDDSSPPDPAAGGATSGDGILLIVCAMSSDAYESLLRSSTAATECRRSGDGNAVIPQEVGAGVGDLSESHAAGLPFSPGQAVMIQGRLRSLTLVDDETLFEAPLSYIDISADGLDAIRPL